MSSVSFAPARADIVSALGGHRVVVLGDLMLDRYLWGKAERISPEAPVPVVKVQREELKLGGAANVALNLAALGDTPVLVGLIGEDSQAHQLRQELAVRNFDDSGLVATAERPTSQKTRVIAGSQQVVRVDREDDAETDGELARAILQRFEAQLPNADAVLISDYGKGTLSAEVVDRAVQVARARGLFVAVDPKETHFHRYRDVSILTPNHHEACFAAGRKVKDDAGIREIGEQLRGQLNAEYLLITRGEAGMTLFARDAAPVHIPTVAQHVYDVTGAGDTVIATLTAAVAGGIDTPDACRLANVAARRAVAEVGSYAVTRDELKRELVALGAT
jgi:D-beta-D-heptose 7-phosphate kinase/D-beta-D-heptose 1-phosphate adenosyltransferase